MNSPGQQSNVPQGFPQDPNQHHFKPFLGRCSGKSIPIGLQQHQVQVPDIYTLQTFSQNRNSIVRDISQFSQTTTFRASNCSHIDLDTYLLFAEQLLEDRDPDVFQQGQQSKEQVRRRACEMLHRCHYNVSKARFMLVFPYFLAYERFSPHRELNLTNEDMDKKVRSHMLSLKDSRSKDLQKWISQIQNQIESKITLTKLNGIIDLAKQNKFEVPQTIRDQIERATKFGRQLKKWCQNKHPLDKLKQKKQQLQEQKIITNEMSNFEQAVTRSEEWSQRAQAFQFDFFNQGQLRNPSQKIDFRMIHSIVQDYLSLPILDISFEATVKKLHDDTQAILERIPQITKVAKTRTSVPSKVSLAVIKKLLDDIDKHTVIHDDFEFFKQYVNESLELIERISMFFEDERCQKTTKIMIGYQKLLNDIPIITNLPGRLEKYMEYSQYIDRIKKDIINPNKFQQTQELITDANKKGFCTAQLYQYESKLKVYRGWFESTQILSQVQTEKRLVDIIKDQRPIIANMIEENVFRDQLHYAKKELNIEPSSLGEYEKRFEQVDRKKQEIRQLLSKQEPDLQTMISTLLHCIKDSIRYPQFISLYMRINHIVTILVKINYLLEMYGFSDGSSTFLKKHQYDELINFVSSKRQMKEMTKSEAQKMLEDDKRPFPKMLPEWKNFQKFLVHSQDWQNKAQNFLDEYARNGQLDDLTLDQLLVGSENVLTNRRVLDHLTEVHLIAKWKGILEQKLNNAQGPPFFTQSQRVQLQILIVNLNAAQMKAQSADMKTLSLNFLHSNRIRIRQLIQLISQCPIDRTQKLPDLIRTIKDLQRLNIRDQQLDLLKDQLAIEIGNCQLWKERYLGLKKYEINKKQQEDDDDKKKHYFKNPHYVYYFKLPILIVQFYHGTRLRIPLDQLNKMKVQFQEIGDYMKKFDTIQRTEVPTFKQVQELQSQGNKINLFFIETWIMKKRGRYVHSWKTMAQTIIETMPILRLQQLQIPKNIDIMEPIAVVQPEPINEPVEPIVKRQRKQNTHYNNDEITLLTEDIFPKKKPRQNVDPERRARMKDKKIMKDYAKYIKQPVVYCICRMGLMNETSIMVCCQGCQIWFHTECLGLKKGMVKSIPKFYCFACAQRIGKEFDYFSLFFWWTRMKLSELEFQSVIKEGRQLGVKIDELNKLQLIEERIKNWQNASNKVLSEIDRANLDKNQRKQSFWLPTKHMETDALRSLSMTFQDFKKNQRSL